MLSKCRRFYKHFVTMSQLTVVLKNYRIECTSVERLKMKFTIIKSEMQGTNIPQIVFDSLNDVTGDSLKVILFVLQNDTTDFMGISNKLNITVASVISSLYFWSDKGILHFEEEKEGKKAKRKALSSADIATLVPNTPEIGELSIHIQKLFGFSLNEKYVNNFIALFLEDGIPIDVILQISAYQINAGQDNPAYSIKVVRNWFTKLGLRTGQSVDDYIILLAKRDKLYNDVCKIFNFESGKLTTSEKTLIASWFEKLDMSLDMISESYIRAGHLANIQYCNGILKAWSQKGFRTPKDLEGEISNVSQSLKNIDSQNDIIMQGMKFVPTFDKSDTSRKGGKQ